MRCSGGPRREEADLVLRRARDRTWCRRYATAQRERLEGTRGQLRVHRPELVARYGFDTKFAGHLLRLAHQGIEYLTTGRLVLPIPDPLGTHLRDVRSGRVPLQEVLAEAAAAEATLKELLTTSPLPEWPDVPRVEAFLLRAYRERWGWEPPNPGSRSG